MTLFYSEPSGRQKTIFLEGYFEGFLFGPETSRIDSPNQAHAEKHDFF